MKVHTKQKQKKKIVSVELGVRHENTFAKLSHKISTLHNMSTVASDMTAFCPISSNLLWAHLLSLSIKSRWRQIYWEKSHRWLQKQPSWEDLKSAQGVFVILCRWLLLFFFPSFCFPFGGLSSTYLFPHCLTVYNIPAGLPACLQQSEICPNIYWLLNNDVKSNHSELDYKLYAKLSHWHSGNQCNHILFPRYSFAGYWLGLTFSRGFTK